MVKGVNSGIMSIAPIDANRIGAHFLHLEHLEHRLEHGKWVFGRGGVVGLLRLCAMRSGATGAGTLVAQIGQRIFAAMAVLPVDFDSFGFGNRDMFG